MLKTVKETVQIETLDNTSSNLSLESPTIAVVSIKIKRRLPLIICGFNRQLSSRVLSHRTKLTLYKTLIIPVLVNGAELWNLRASAEKSLGTFEKKNSTQDGKYRRRVNRELCDLYYEVKLDRRIKMQRLRWLRYIVRMDIQAQLHQVQHTEVKDN